MLARTLVEQGRHNEALQHYARVAGKQGTPIQLEYARALDLAGEATGGEALRNVRSITRWS